MRIWALAAIAGTLTLSISAAQAQRERLPGECRREVVQLCGLGGGREGLRECLRARSSELSVTCRTAILTRVSERAAARAPVPAGAREFGYGDDPRQRLDYWSLADGARRPLVVFVHGGGWSIGDKRTGLGVKHTHFTGQGLAFASVNYRLVPQVTPAEQAADIALAIALLRREPGVDAGRIVLIGHSAGAHLVALLGTDTRFLERAGVPTSSIRGIVTLDGAAYDVARQMTAPDNRVMPMYLAAFSTDPARQAALSPVAHSGAPNVADWLIVSDAARADAQAQSDALAAALRQAGSRTQRLPLSGTTHRAINMDLGKPGDAMTTRVDAFIAGVVR